MQTWQQHYDPLGNIYLSALVAAIPAALLLVLIAGLNVKIHRAALIAAGACLLVAIGFYRMPVGYAAASAVFGAGYGLFPIGWLVINIIFVYQLTVQRGLFDVLRRSLGRAAPDPRIQVILIAFAFGSFLEGMSGFGAPVAITAAVLIQLGFPPLQASGLALVANTAPVAFGSLGIPLTTLQQVTDLDLRALSATTAHLLAPFCLGIPFLIVIKLAGWRGLAGVWPAALVGGVSYAVPQFLLATYHGPWLAAPVAGLSCITALVLLMRFWTPAQRLCFAGDGSLVAAGPKDVAEATETPRQIFDAWLPWAIVTVFIFLWGIPAIQAFLDKLCPLQFNMPWLHGLIERMPPVAPAAATIPAPFKLHLLSATGTGIFFASILVGAVIGCSPGEWLKCYLTTIWRIRLSLLTMAAMLALGTITRYSGADGTLGLALAHTGSFYPFFGTLLGWIGAAITGSDTSTNVLFGSLQKITAQQIGVSAVLMCAANTCGGVMGKMISSQSIVVASTATNWYGHEGRILRYVFLTSVCLASLMGVLVYIAAYFVPALHS